MAPRGDAPLRLQPGDVLLVCTDGLTGCASDEEIAEILGKARTSEDACGALIALALDRGAPDNVTAIVARYLE
jgi:protein phosphatase